MYEINFHQFITVQLKKLNLFSTVYILYIFSYGIFGVIMMKLKILGSVLLKCYDADSSLNP